MNIEENNLFSQLSWKLSYPLRTMILKNMRKKGFADCVFSQHLVHLVVLSFQPVKVSAFSDFASFFIDYDT